MAGLAVVHLVRKQNGLAPLDRFLASYRGFHAGTEHDLVILFKGFDGPIPEYARCLEGTAHRSLYVSDRGFELNAYFDAVRRLDYDRYCFLNSFSRILDEGWLEKLNRWSSTEGVGLVGATGSFQSIAGGYTKEEARLRSLPPAVQAWKRLGRALKDRPEANAQRAMRLLLRMAGVWRPRRDFAGFPNPHIRTNAFMATREVLSKIRIGPMRMKISAYKFESGKDGLTSQVRNLGLRTLVVGRDGRGYEPADWHLSNTFWQSREENLLVADNQTERYLSANAEKRAELAQYAWGDHARPL